MVRAVVSVAVLIPTNSTPQPQRTGILAARVWIFFPSNVGYQELFPAYHQFPPLGGALTYGPGQETGTIDVLHLCPDAQRFPRDMHGHISIHP